jgi:glutathione peroxidase
MPIYDVEATTITGEKLTLKEFQGKVLLIVNVASKCGLTPQYSGLQKLYDTYKDKGFEILGFPCNQFLSQEPGTEKEILEFCRTNYSVTFPMFSKIEVNGENRHPLYQILTNYPDSSGNAGDITWNFEKFLINRDATQIKRFRPQIEPQSEEIITAIEEFLN